MAHPYLFSFFLRTSEDLLEGLEEILEAIGNHVGLGFAELGLAVKT